MALQEACRDGHKHLPSPTKAACAGARWGSCSGWVTRTWPRPAWAGPAAPPLRDEAVTALSCCQCCLEPGLLQEPWGLGASFSLLVLTETSPGAGATCRCWCYLLLCKHTAAALQACHETCLWRILKPLGDKQAKIILVPRGLSPSARIFFFFAFLFFGFVLHLVSSIVWGLSWQWLSLRQSSNRFTGNCCIFNRLQFIIEVWQWSKQSLLHHSRKPGQGCCLQKLLCGSVWACTHESLSAMWRSRGSRCSSFSS